MRERQPREIVRQRERQGDGERERDRKIMRERHRWMRWRVKYREQVP